MSLSPLAIPFFSCISSSKLCKRNQFLCKARDSLSYFDANLFCKILEEWESCTDLYSCFSQWQRFTYVCDEPSSSSFHVLLLNVRGLDLRWQEVLLLLLLSSFEFNTLILLETDDIEISFHQKLFCNYRFVYQKGENRNGGVIMLIKEGISISRVPCKLPNVRIVDVIDEEEFRLIGIYAPTSETWIWDDLFPFLSKRCIMFGDFNVDIMQGGKKLKSYSNELMNIFLLKLYRILQLRCVPIE